MNQDKALVIRIIVLLLVLVNMFLVLFGKNPLPYSEEQFFTGVSAVAATISIIWNTWKNNNFTPEAYEAQTYLDSRKAQNRKLK